MKTLALMLSLLGVSALPASPPPPVHEAVQPIQVIQTVRAVLPASLLDSAHPEGEATALIMVDAEGSLIDVMVLGYTAPEFGTAAERALRRWSYKPARRGAEPVGARQAVTLRFSSAGSVVSLTPATTLRRLNRSLAPTQQRQVVGGDDLDGSVEVVQRVPPAGLPPAEPGTPTRVTLDFYIDQEGRPRLATIVGDVSEPHAAAALAALEQWRFSPPTRHGRPAVVHVRQEFVFAGQS